MTEYKGSDLINEDRFKEDWDYFNNKYGGSDGDMIGGLLSFAAIVAILRKAFQLDDFEVSLDDE